MVEAGSHEAPSLGVFYDHRTSRIQPVVHLVESVCVFGSPGDHRWPAVHLVPVIERDIDEVREFRTVLWRDSSYAHVFHSKFDFTFCAKPILSKALTALITIFLSNKAQDLEN